MRGSLGEKIGEGCSADIHAWAPGQVVKLFKPGGERRLCRHEAQMTRAAFAAGLPAPEVFDEVTLEGRFGIVLSRFDGPTLLRFADLRRHDARAGGRDPRGPLHIRSQDAPAAGRNLPARLDTGLGAVPRQPASEAPRHGRPCPAREPPPGDGLCHGDILPSNVIMTAEGPETHRLDLDEARGPRPRLGALPRRPLRSSSRKTRRFGAARAQCGCAVRVRAAGRHVSRGADGSDGIRLAHRPRLLPPRMGG